MPRLYAYGQDVPAWLQKVSPAHVKCTFAYALIVVWKWKGEYWVAPLLPIGKAVFHVDGMGEAVHVDGGPTNCLFWHYTILYLPIRAYKKLLALGSR